MKAKVGGGERERDVGERGICRGGRGGGGREKGGKEEDEEVCVGAVSLLLTSTAFVLTLTAFVCVRARMLHARTHGYV